MNYVKPTPKGVDPDTRDRANEIGRSLTPKSDRPRQSYGSLLMSAQTVSGLCEAGTKCVLKDGHSAPCWPV